MGDYNIHTLNELKNDTTHIHEFIYCIFSTYYYHILINLPTRVRTQSSPLLDNIYTNIPDCYDIGTSEIQRFLPQSIHYPIFTMRKNVIPEQPIKYITKRTHNQQNIAISRKYLKKKSNWTEMGLYQKKSISQMFTLFTNTILQYFHLSFPLEKKEIRYKNRTRGLHKN